MSELSQPNTLQDILKWEEDNHYSREAVTVLSGQNLAMGAVVGKITMSMPAEGTPDLGNNGAGTVTEVTSGAKVKLGTYKITAKVAASASPLVDLVCEVTDPDGNSLPDAGAGAYAGEQINFTIAQGSPEIDVGDTWTIEIAEGSGHVKAIDFDAVDGSRDAFGIVIAAYDATDGDVPGVAVVRDAIIVPDDLVWPATSPAVTDDQKAAALAQLGAKGIVPRVEG